MCGYLCDGVVCAAGLAGRGFAVIFGGDLVDVALAAFGAGEARRDKLGVLAGRLACLNFVVGRHGWVLRVFSGRGFALRWTHEAINMLGVEGVWAFIYRCFRDSGDLLATCGQVMPKGRRGPLPIL